MVTYSFGAARKQLVVYVMLCLLLGSCSRPTPTDFGDGGILSAKPCGPPCFWNVIAGQTREAEARQIFTDVLKLNDCHEFDNEATSGLRGVSCNFLVGINFRRGSDIVAGISYKPPESLTLQDVISHHGQPDTVDIVASGLPEHPRTVMTLHFDHIRTSLILVEQEGYLFTVTPSTSISSVGYADDETYAVMRAGALSWHGYDTYQRNEPEQ